MGLIFNIFLTREQYQTVYEQYLTVCEQYSCPPKAETVQEKKKQKTQNVNAGFSWNQTGTKSLTTCTSRYKTTSSLVI